MRDCCDDEVGLPEVTVERCEVERAEALETVYYLAKLLAAAGTSTDTSKGALAKALDENAKLREELEDCEEVKGVAGERCQTLLAHLSGVCESLRARGVRVASDEELPARVGEVLKKLDDTTTEAGHANAARESLCQALGVPEYKTATWEQLLEAVKGRIREWNGRSKQLSDANQALDEARSARQSDAAAAYLSLCEALGQEPAGSDWGDKFKVGFQGQTLWADALNDVRERVARLNAFEKRTARNYEVFHERTCRELEEVLGVPVDEAHTVKGLLAKVRGFVADCVTERDKLRDSLQLAEAARDASQAADSEKRGDVQELLGLGVEETPTWDVLLDKLKERVTHAEMADEALGEVRRALGEDNEPFAEDAIARLKSKLEKLTTLVSFQGARLGAAASTLGKRVGVDVEKVPYSTLVDAVKDLQRQASEWAAEGLITQEEATGTPVAGLLHLPAMEWRDTYNKLKADVRCVLNSGNTDAAKVDMLDVLLGRS